MTRASRAAALSRSLEGAAAAAAAATASGDADPAAASLQPARAPPAAPTPLGGSSDPRIYYCDLGGCTQWFPSARALLTHQEGSKHAAPPAAVHAASAALYFCPFGADRCPRAPCGHARGGTKGPLPGGWVALCGHIAEAHSGHVDAAVSTGLNLREGKMGAYRA